MRSSVKVAAMTAAAPSLVIALPLLITGCSSASSSPPSSPTLPASSVSSTSPASSGGSSLSADQIASNANADLKAASSYHVSGTITAGGVAETDDLTSESGKCKGTISLGSGTSITMVLIGKTLWVKAGQSGTYVKTTTSNADYRQMITSCSPAEQASELAVLTGLTKAGTTVIRGQSVLQLRDAAAGSIYETESATPEYVRVDIPGLERLDFTGINAPASINPPPASEVLGA